MNAKLKNRLKDVNLEIEDILKEIKIPQKCFVVLYTSHIDSLGSSESDFDVYVVYDAQCLENVEINKAASIVINGVEIDIEYHDINEVTGFFQRENRQVHTSYLSFLLRLLRGEVIHLDNELSKCIHEHIDKDRLEKIAIDTYWLDSLSAYNDALKMFNIDEHVCGIVLARNALNHITMAINIINKDYVFKPKWAYLLLKRSLGESHDLVRNYERFTLGSVDNPEIMLEELLYYIQNLTTKVRLWDGSGEI